MKLYGYVPKDGDVIVKSRIHRWFDIKEQKVLYGVMVKIDGQLHKFYGHVLDKKTKHPVLFDDELDAEKFRNELIARAAIRKAEGES